MTEDYYFPSSTDADRKELGIHNRSIAYCIFMLAMSFLHIISMIYINCKVYYKPAAIISAYEKMTLLLLSLFIVTLSLVMSIMSIYKIVKVFADRKLTLANITIQNISESHS